ncbi:hypothetical protein F3Y22_tig00116951pilonHSYRG00466 [Hibiscus syriacus]|uniref:Uncharacterized protein n=1 Tax=Hibiscus syriacus TaxID=106335 RepID=A0A6A2WLC3_HIBSY|nr:hypothetical protein F3Y22_tig00116951pilonHSYRG00466 [Hibiscus syriacus]
MPIALPPAMPKQAPNRVDLARIADSLKEDCQIGFIRHQPRRRQRFGQPTVASSIPLKPSLSQLNLLREPLNYSTAQLQHYSTEQSFAQDRYDPFLHHLLFVIKPTHLFGTTEDVIYIPLLSNINFDNFANPFGINKFMMNAALVQGLLDCMDDRKSKWRTVPLPHETLGRPFWLLDWKQDQAYAWNPQEGHFSKEDLISAQILGIPCTLRLGPEMLMTANILTADIIASNYNRVTTRCFYGAAEHQPDPTTTSSTGSRNMELTPVIDSHSQPQQSPPRPPRPASFYQYQLIDCCYHGLVVLELNVQTQEDALRSFLITYFSNMFSYEPLSSKVVSLEENDFRLPGELAGSGYEINENNGSGAVLEEESEDHDLERKD